MNNPKNRYWQMQELTYTGDSPYENLFIYYFQGRIPNGLECLDERFLGNWEEDDTSFLFFSQPARDAIQGIVIRYPHLELLDQYHMTWAQWHGEEFEPFAMGQWIVRAPWHQISPNVACAGEILLDPGVVFGTGKHPTTLDCLDLLQQVCDTHSIQTVVDIGTGTGLLAVAAGRFGCQRVLAVDLNRLAVRTTKRNIELNELNRHVLAVQGDAVDFLDIGAGADLIIANIHYEVMEKLIGKEAFLSYRWFILSGLLRDQAKAIATALPRNRVKIHQTRSHEGIWHTLFGEIVSH